MGLGGISLWQLLIVLLIVVLVFGTKKIRGMGKDLGGAVKGFRDAMNDAEKKPPKLADDSEDASFETEEKQNTGAKQ